LILGRGETIKPPSSSLLDEPMARLMGMLRRKEISVATLAEAVIAREHLLRPTRAFTFFDPEDLRRQAARLDRLGPPRNSRERPLFGVPVSVKDIFDVLGWPTTGGSSFLAALRGRAKRDSSYVARWRKAGALIVGKTHLNQFAYGITGENLHLGPCLQPTRPHLLTGGSSSGAAATVQGGAVCLGLGTDTAGSLRVPAALCGLAAFRHSAPGRKSAGLFPLAPSFDTCGWLQRDLEDIATVFFALADSTIARPRKKWRIAFLWGSWLQGCDREIIADFRALRDHLGTVPEVIVSDAEATGFDEAPDLFAPLQAYEAARVHRPFLRRHAAAYEPAILARLRAGSSTGAVEHRRLQRKRAEFCRNLRRLMAPVDFLVAPAAPYRHLVAGEDHATKRHAILQLTTPFSLGGLPVLAAPWKKRNSFVFQLVATRGEDAKLALVAQSLSRWLRDG
jgi:aspartyl-tRNA(Asn)/glutamyl-tRNA(Gln) amidotransferase subunit A